MNEWTFRLNLVGLDVDDDEQMDALFEAGCDDATFGTDEAGAHAVFHREAPTPEAAVLSAIRSIENAGIDARVVRVENEDEWLAAAEIAERIGRTRQSIGQLISGKRGPGHFPTPVVRRDARNPLWSWDEVCRWFATYDPDAVPARPDRPSPDFIAAVNDRLDERERRRQSPNAPWWPELADVLPLVS
jgi:hypothetical protein